MSGIAELFELRRAKGLAPERERELFRLLREELLPFLARGQAESGEGPPAKRKASGLPYAVEDYWQDFMAKICADRFWPREETPPVVTPAYLATCFRHYLNSQRRKPAIDVVAPSVHEGDENEHVVTAYSGDGEVTAQEAGESNVATEHHGRLGSNERGELSRKYLRLAKQLLDAHHRLPWLPRLIELQLEPIFLEGVDPILKSTAAGLMGVAPATITKYVQAFGLPSPSGRTTPSWSETILGKWVTQQCGIADPQAEPDKLLLALDALCRRNYELRRRNSDHA